ncbi:putative terminal deoxynucleotidyl [Phaeomoniella chlamydospora]|uniref:DNA polymerase n=1 Tax=Phaeomoniella chlamydospora TaxID=158046 RepID=A0A0G2EF15_PHACM|nr:putative terminal deoxynucleotidyl [Phaeomoniella chlamydospora]
MPSTNISHPPSEDDSIRPNKRRRLSRPSNTLRTPTTSSTASDDESSASEIGSPSRVQGDEVEAASTLIPDLTDRVLVINIDWITKSILAEKLLPVEPFIVYTARPIKKPKTQTTPKPARTPITYVKANPDTSSTSGIPKEQYNGILSRAQADAVGVPESTHRRRLGDRSSLHVKTSAPPRLHRTTTSEFEAESDISIPEPPSWVKSHEVYACRRSTFANPPNAAFIAELQKIRKARILTLDEIGERAYATSISSISAYPYYISHPAEILQLPGCDTRIASLWADWRATGDTDDERYIPAARELDNNEDLKILKQFYDIWGVGAETARKFYFTRGWKEMDDVIEFGWNELNRVQQIGLKYYDEFLIGIPRSEVETINQIVLDHARKCRNIPRSAYNTTSDFVSVIVGGYRRGKDKSGDVDLILSHSDENMTHELVLDVVSALEQSGWITHTLTLNTTTSNRGQQTLPYRSAGGGHGFDSLDKGLVVWQDPNFLNPSTGSPTTTNDAAASGIKNPNIHRRVDIIISPWRTVGCAVLGWSGATTFERDIRRWAKKEKQWKFDSSGIRDRATGQTVDLEGPGKTWEEREKLVMEGLGIGWRPPGERWTG